MQRRSIVACYVLLVAVGVPWYWQVWPEQAMTLLLGIPLWVLTAVLASLLCSIFTVWINWNRWTVPDQRPIPRFQPRKSTGGRSADD